MGVGPNKSLRSACYGNLLSMSQLMVLAGMHPGDSWFVDSTVSTGRDGSSWGNACKTLAAVYAKAAAGDTIYMKGSFNEAVNCTKEGLSFVGVGNRNRQCLWTAPTGAAAYCLTAGAAYINVQGIYFKAPAYSVSGVPAALKLSGANYLTVNGCKFQGQIASYNAIYSAVCDSDNVTIEDCEFNYFNTATNGCAILGVEAGGLSYSGWKLERCKFGSNLKHLNVNMRNSWIHDCTFPVGGIDPAGAMQAALTDLCIDLSGTSSGGNHVGPGNSFGGAYTSSLYVGGAAADNWAGNYGAITATYCPNGITVPAKPA